MQGSYGPAIAHIHSGSKILYEMEFNEDTKQHNHEVLAASKFPYVPMEALEELFLRLDISVVEVGFSILSTKTNKKILIPCRWLVGGSSTSTRK